MQLLVTRRTATFIVRIWTEYLDRPTPAWRGEIEDVQTKEVIRFRGLVEMEAYVERCVLAQLSRGDEEDVR